MKFLFIVVFPIRNPYLFGLFQQAATEDECSQEWKKVKVEWPPVMSLDCCSRLNMLIFWNIRSISLGLGFFHFFMQSTSFPFDRQWNLKLFIKENNMQPMTYWNANYSPNSLMAMDNVFSNWNERENVSFQKYSFIFAGKSKNYIRGTWMYYAHKRRQFVVKSHHYRSIEKIHILMRREEIKMHKLMLTTSSHKTATQLTMIFPSYFALWLSQTSEFMIPNRNRFWHEIKNPIYFFEQHFFFVCSFFSFLFFSRIIEYFINFSLECFAHL